MAKRGRKRERSDRKGLILDQKGRKSEALGRFWPSEGIKSEAFGRSQLAEGIKSEAFGRRPRPKRSFAAGFEPVSKISKKCSKIEQKCHKIDDFRLFLAKNQAFWADFEGFSSKSWPKINFLFRPFFDFEAKNQISFSASKMKIDFISTSFSKMANPASA